MKTFSLSFLSINCTLIISTWIILSSANPNQNVNFRFRKLQYLDSFSYFSRFSIFLILSIYFIILFRNLFLFNCFFCFFFFVSFIYLSMGHVPYAVNFWTKINQVSNQQQTSQQQPVNQRSSSSSSSNSTNHTAGYRDLLDYD